MKIQLNNPLVGSNCCLRKISTEFIKISVYLFIYIYLYLFIYLAILTINPESFKSVHLFSVTQQLSH